MKLKITSAPLLMLALTATLSSSHINPSNPPAGRTGAPGETTCQASGCHSGGSFSGTVELTGIPDTVVADQTYLLTLTNTSNAVRAGYQLTVLDENNMKVGTLVTGTGSSLANAGGRQYIRQSNPRTLVNGSTAWTFSWKAPAQVENDSVHFYFASLCANGNGQITGDNALKNSKSAVLPAFVSTVEGGEENFKLEFYPNPASDFLNIQMPGIGAVKVLDSKGQEVIFSMVNHAAKLDISELPSGLYFARIELNGQFLSRIFMKK